MNKGDQKLPFSINYNSKKELKILLDELGIGMRKKFGQNFLINPSSRKNLIDALELTGNEIVFEVGPGLGAMTLMLLEKALSVTAFEIDPAFCKLLLDIFSQYKNFILVQGDVLKTWKQNIDTNHTKDIFLFSNLPYNIGSILLADFIENGFFFKRIVVTVQKEVAERMAAKPNSKLYSSFSVLCSSVYKVTLLNKMDSSSFYPEPNVSSQAVRMDLLQQRESYNSHFYSLVRALFNQRRKTIKNSLSAHLTGFPKVLNAKDVLAMAKINGERRPETLEVIEFTKIASAIEQISREQN